MKKLALIVLLLASFEAHTAEIFNADVGVWAGVEHITNDQDAVQLGVSLEWDHFDLDMSTGIKRMKWRAIGEPQWDMDEWQSGSIVSLTWYPFNTKTVRPMLLYSHSSDVARGKPFNDNNEPTADFVGVGLTFQKSRFEIDLAVGRSARECDLLKCHKSASTTEAMIRIKGYIWK